MRDGELEGMQCFDSEIEKLIRGGVVSLSAGLLSATNAGNLGCSWRTSLTPGKSSPKKNR